MPGHEQLGGELEQDHQQGDRNSSLAREVLQRRQRTWEEYDGDHRQPEERPHDAVDAPVDAAWKVRTCQRHSRGSHGPVRVAAAA